MMKTDTELQRDILAELDWQPSINAGDIGVQVKDGIVTLIGHVGSLAEKWDAERAVRQVSGVQALTIALDVRLAGASVRDDVDIARTVVNALLWSTAVPANAIAVTVDAGIVELTGEVSWVYQRDAAVLAVRNLMGVVAVSDRITVKPQLTTILVKDQIEAALKRRAHQDASRVTVSVQGAEVTLTGQVQNWTEHQLVCHSAWSTAGVHNVIDHLSFA